ncbi:hypothetical protein O7606_13405 [Micromonospora sp. WMMD882]|uniref:hypothetical protein n=1 Tax=Micromonospora sp. WMMD882 TaxID=3015151 RepID=UPI00248CC242|nr:hypothetical protein [Micromonospora sp. WMMD882]WBB77297.1 hypothetical protein O7606_13405 [Micromonospora sp. WMMD882]
MASAALRSGPSLSRGAGLAPRRRPARTLVPLLLLVLVLVALLAWLVTRVVPAQLGERQLERTVLVGPRGPACLRMVMVVDISGSMADFAAPRDRALDRLFSWLGDNLRDGDEVAVVDFAAEAATRVPATDYRTARLTGPTGAKDGRDTLVRPALDQVRRLGPTTCDTELMFISDAQINDLPGDADAGRRILADTDVHGIHLLVPGEEVEVDDRWTVAFPSAAPIRFDGNDADETALTLGEAVAAVTGQRLEQRPA